MIPNMSSGLTFAHSQSQKWTQKTHFFDSYNFDIEFKTDFFTHLIPDLSPRFKKASLLSPFLSLRIKNVSSDLL